MFSHLETLLKFKLPIFQQCLILRLLGFLNYVFILYVCFVCMYIHAPCVCLVPVKPRRGHWILWHWNYRWCVSPLWYWVPKLGPLQEQKVFLTMEMSLQSQAFSFGIKIKLFWNFNEFLHIWLNCLLIIYTKLAILVPSPPFAVSLIFVFSWAHIFSFCDFIKFLNICVLTTEYCIRNLINIEIFSCCYCLLFLFSSCYIYK